jgi:hypothetical protein
MTEQLTISAFSDEPGWGRALVASLPRSLRRVDDSAGDAALVDGRADWTGIALAQVERGCRRILVTDPAAEDGQKIARLADAVEACGAVCILSESFASDPAISGFRDWLGPEFGTIALESTAASAPDSALLTQLRLLRACGINALEFSHLSRTATACLAEVDATLDGQRVHLRLSAVQSVAGPERHLITAYAPAASARLDLVDGGEALPATASLFTTGGLQTLPSIHESAHRHDLRALLEGGQANAADVLRALADDINLAAALHANGRGWNSR